MDFVLIFIWILIFLAWYIYQLAFQNSSYFKDRGVKFEKPLPIFGNILKFVMKKRNTHLLLADLYKKFGDEKIFGFFMMRKPFYVVRDPDIIKDMCIKDFDHFVDHARFVNPNVDPIFAAGLPFQKGQKWKNTRTVVSPVFTSNKMKMMFKSLTENAKDFVEHYEEHLKNQKRVIFDTKHEMSKFTISGIASCVFSMKTNILKDENDKFTEEVRGLLNIGFNLNVKLLISTAFPRIYNLLGLRILTQKSIDFAHSITIDAIKYREENNIQRKDVLQLLMEAMKGKLKYEESAEDTANFSAHKEYLTEIKPSKNQGLTELDVISQGFLFFFAGFETTSNLLAMVAYELAKNPDVQDELIQEVDEVLGTLDGEAINYEQLHKMKFLDMVICEGLRMYPPGPQANNRECTKAYTFESNGTTIKLEPGANIMFPVLGLHYDVKMWPNPKRFDPHRFSDENKKSIHPGAYLPFGTGPRACIGSRFALMEAKACIFYLLTKLKFCVCEKTVDKVEFECTVPPLLKKQVYIELKLR